MNIFEVQGNWNITRGELKPKFAQFTDNDRRLTEGKEVELVGRIPKRTGQTRQGLTSIIGEYCAPDLSGERSSESHEGNET